MSQQQKSSSGKTNKVLSPTTDAYGVAYQQLNTQQRQAVDAIEGPVMVLAGPGTGKTQIMSLRIANILLKTDTQPHNVLALTFTNAAAKNLQQRLRKYIGAAAYGVKCTTFHSFAAEFIAENQQLFPVLPVVEEPVSQLEQFSILEEIFAENEFMHLKNPKNPYYYVREALQVLLNYKREGLSPLQIKQIAAREAEEVANSDLTARQKKKAQRNLEKNLDLAQIYSEYQHKMRERQLFDYEDLIIWVRDALRQHEEIRLEYQERYHYFLIDEYQDTNEGQLQIVRELASYWGQQANIFAVGDPNQSIYRFQGASLANTLSFLDHYPAAEVISLTKGYRCGQNIYDAAAALISHNPLEIKDDRLQSLHQPLQQPDNHEGRIVTYEAPTPMGETIWILQQLRQLHKQGSSWSDMAVLYRKHADADLLIELLQREGIPHQLVQNQSILDNPLIAQLNQFLQFLVALRSQAEGSLVLPVLQIPWLQLSSQDVMKLIRFASQSTQHQKNIWNVWMDDEALNQIGLQNIKRWQQLRQLLLDLHQRSGQLPLPQFIEELLRRTNFYLWAQQGNVPTVDLVALSDWLQHLSHWTQRQRQADLEHFLTDIERLQLHSLAWEQEPVQLESEAVVLSTAHQAKGQEWDHVFIMRAQNKNWGNTSRRDLIKPLAGTIPYAQLDEQELNEDERRLFYVALTRAKKRVNISFSQQTTTSERTKQLQSSQFIWELPQDLVSEAESIPSSRVISQIRSYLTKHNSWKPEELDEQWLRSLVDNFSFSYTALNDFEACPVSFFYKHLLRIPQRPSSHLLLGSAVHAGLEALYNYFNQKHKQPPVTYIQSAVAKQLQHPLMSERELAELEAKAQSIVYDFWQHHQQEMRPSLMVERFFGNNPSLQYAGLSLVGKIDRLDMIDELAGTVRVVDYKTGKTHSRNSIEGKIASSDGHLFRQLLFYRLLGDLDSSFKYQITEGEFIFVEPNKSGKYKSERFKLTAEKVDELKQQLQEVEQKFHSLDFMDAEPCQHCDFCKMLGFTPSRLQEYARQELEITASSNS